MLRMLTSAFDLCVRGVYAKIGAPTCGLPELQQRQLCWSTTTATTTAMLQVQRVKISIQRKIWLQRTIMLSHNMWQRARNEFVAWKAENPHFYCTLLLPLEAYQSVNENRSIVASSVDGRLCHIQTLFMQHKLFGGKQIIHARVLLAWFTHTSHICFHMCVCMCACVCVCL